MALIPNHSTTTWDWLATQSKAITITGPNQITSHHSKGMQVTNSITIMKVTCFWLRSWTYRINRLRKVTWRQSCCRIFNWTSRMFKSLLITRIKIHSTLQWPRLKEKDCQTTKEALTLPWWCLTATRSLNLFYLQRLHNNLIR